jgi:subtilisin family serine protease
MSLPLPSVRSRGLGFLGFVVALIATAALALPAESMAERGSDSVIPGRYIVVFKDSVVGATSATKRLERANGFAAKHRYRAALKGFSAKLARGQVARLRADDDVALVAPDRRVQASGWQPIAPGEPTPPPGVRRILAGSTTQVREHSGTNVAVLDTGIKLSHTDLNAADGTNCVSPGSPADDAHGHGTHVAGSIGAKNNGSGVVGVAPNTKTYAVKVLGDNGSGSFASVICGIDWVTANRAALNIGVANMSLGGTGGPVEGKTCATTTDPMRRAICASTSGGTNYVVAAGNDGWDFDYQSSPNVPAAYPEALTVTSVADSDGQKGAAGGNTPCSWQVADDTPAPFSNYAATAAGEAHTIAAPGVCVNSTWSDGGYRSISGTSMASPHMAGVVALCINEAGANGPCASKTAPQVISHMRDDAQTYNANDPSYGFTGDPLNDPSEGVYYGLLTRVPAPAVDTTPPDTLITSGPTGTTKQTSASFSFTSTESGSTFECKLDAGAFGSCSSPKTYSSLSEGAHTFSVRATDAAGNADQTPASRTFTVDSIAPTAKAPLQAFKLNSQLGASTVPVGLSWPAGSDNQTSASSLRYDLEQQTGTGSYARVASNTSARSLTRSLAQNGTYRFRVRSRDAAGNVSAWATGAAFKVTPFQESSSAIAYSGTWKRTALSGAFGGSVKYTSAASAKATLTSTGRNVAVVMPKRSGLGQAKICVDGASCSTVSLSSSTSKPRQVVYKRDGLSTATHKVTVSRVSGRIDLDGFVVLR